jgi:CrcB protein
MYNILLACVFGGLGCGARYLVALGSERWLSASFPLGTLLVNLLGSFAIAVVMHLATKTALMAPAVRVALVTGFLGGFTTYSSFTYETLNLLQGGAVGLGLAYLVGTVAGCLLCGVLGLLCAGWAVGR